jgi:predicted component of type VI protein secretion system
MSTAGARALREDDNGMSREAVLLQWERKIEDAERRESGRFERTTDGDVPLAEPVPLRPTEDSTSPVSAKHSARPSAHDLPPKRFERRTPPAGGHGVEAHTSPPPASTAVAERRTIQIAGQPTPARRRRSVVEAQMAQPDRIALWAFLLGLFLVAVAAGTAHT